MTPTEKRRAAVLLEEHASLLWVRYKTYRYGQPWDTPQARQQYYEHRRLAMRLREDAP